jgi:hypothetical protein
MMCGNGRYKLVTTLNAYHARRPWNYSRGEGIRGWWKSPVPIHQHHLNVMPTRVASEWHAVALRDRR